MKPAAPFIPITALLVVAAALLAYEAWHTGLTADEPSHFAAAQQYWLGNNVLHPSDPPLGPIIAGWVPCLMGAPVRHDTDAWRAQRSHEIGAETLGKLDGPHARRLIFFTRLPFLIFPLGIVLLVWHWARQLWSDPTAMVLAIGAALEPTILGHGALIKPDVAAAFGALAFAYAAWRYWIRPDFRRLLWMTASLIVALLAKFTLLPLLALAFVLVLIKGPRLAGAILIPLAVYVAILAAYQFQAARIAPREFDFGAAGIPEFAEHAFLATPLPWPRPFVRGVLFVTGSIHNANFRGWMLGHRIEGMAPGYYPLAWAIKSPIALQLLLLAGIAALVLRLKRREAGVADAFIWGFPAFFFGTAVLSNFHIGYRHVLPALPFFILGGGFALDRWSGSRAARWSIAAMLVFLAASSLHVYPQGISYFNEWIGGPNNGWHYLADSNLDWGQNLPELGEWCWRNNARKVRMNIFGLDEPSHYLPGGWQPLPYPWSADPAIPRRFQPTTGTYAVSTNMLVGMGAAPGWEDYLAFFRDRTPSARVAYTIMIYEIE